MAGEMRLNRGRYVRDTSTEMQANTGPGFPWGEEQMGVRDTVQATKMVAMETMTDDAGWNGRRRTH